jgi:antitoxin component of RelBE/YafQ-DinJ toxin-antitoxin module
MSKEKSLQIATAIKNHLVELATNDNLPLDMTQLDENALAEIIDSFSPSRQEKAVEEASHYLCFFDDEETGEEVSIKTQLERIAAHPDQDDFIDNVEGVMVWEKVEYSFTCDQFLDQVGWVD